MLGSVVVRRFEIGEKIIRQATESVMASFKYMYAMVVRAY